MKKAKFALKITALISVVFFFFSCNPLENTSQSNTLLVVLQILGTDIEDNAVEFLQSDVVKVDADTGLVYVVADSATVSLKAQIVDPSSEAQASFYNDIMVTRYVVSYSRADGNNQPGVDIPYSFEGSLSTLIPIGSSTEISFIIIREVAKMEPPLYSLAIGRDEGVLQVTAKVEFYGHDMANNKVKGTGYLAIFFANYTDS